MSTRKWVRVENNTAFGLLVYIDSSLGDLVPVPAAIVLYHDIPDAENRYMLTMWGRQRLMFETEEEAKKVAEVLISMEGQS